MGAGSDDTIDGGHDSLNALCFYPLLNFFSRFFEGQRKCSIKGLMLNFTLI
jgi:hypothetical protein